MQMRVMAIEDALTTKLMAITEHDLRFEGLLPIAIISPADDAPEAGARGEPHVRVLTNSGSGAAAEG
jgi:hypothetical protein